MNTIETIKEIWKEILESDEEMETNVSFFEMGGNSMLATLMIENVNEKLSTDFELVDIYENNTIDQLAALIESKRK